MLVAYFDESGLDERSRVFCIAGYVAESPDWFELERAWAARLREDSVPFFHMADFESRRGHFVGWANSRRIAFIKDLIAIINATDVYGIGTGVDIEAFRKVMAEVPCPPSVPMDWWSHPWALAFQDCLAQCAIAADERPYGEKLSFVFDRQHTYQARAEEAHRQIQAHPIWPHKHRIGSLTFGAKTDYVALQVADFAVYEVRKAIEHKLYEPDRAERQSMARLRRRFRNPRYFDEPTLRESIRLTPG
jgi:Protein of unknown function (DUF3800)